MADQDTNDLIQSLVSDCKPVTQLKRPISRFLNWFLVGALSLGSVFLVIGIRSDFLTAMRNPQFLLQSISILILSVSSAIAAFLLSVPGHNKSKIAKLFPIIPLTCWMGLLIYSVIIQQLSEDGLSWASSLGLYCVGDILMVALIPSALLFLMIRKAAPIQLGWTGFFALLSVGSLGAFGSQMMCSSNNSIHLMVWHYFPVIIIGLMGIVFGKKILKW